MAKLTLSDVTNISGNPTSAQTTINNNNDAIEAALENTLSRDGTSPNTMAANLDMNSHRILNLPEPVADQEPVRLVDFTDVVGTALATAVAAATATSTAAATTATTEAGIATAAASTATTEAGIATTEAGIATTQAGNAATSAASAATDAASVAAALSGALANLSVDASMSVTADVALSPFYVIQNWANKFYPTVVVEKAYGSGIKQALYPWKDGKLYTGTLGSGTDAATFAGADLLIVDTIYNQALASPTTAGHPVKISDDRRVILDVSVVGAPRFAGYGSGSQDVSQHATERGYHISQDLDRSSYYQQIALNQMSGAEICNLIQDQATGSTVYWEVDGGNKRHFNSWSINVSFWTQNNRPQLISNWMQNLAELAANKTNEAQTWCIPQDISASAAPSSTLVPLNVFGPTNPLKGYLYALIIVKSSLPVSLMAWTGSDNICRAFASVACKTLSANQFDVAFPYSGYVAPMDMTTSVGDIPIKIIGRPSQAFEANWAGGSWTAIGTTEAATGILETTLPAQAAGDGTLGVREASSGTSQSITHVGVGLFLAFCGESELAGRGDAVSITIPTNFLRRNGLNWTPGNEYQALICQNLYDIFTCPINVTNAGYGSTFIYPKTTEAHWDPNSPRASVVSNYMDSLLGLRLNQANLYPPNFIYFDIGKNDATQNTGSPTYKNQFTILKNAYQTYLASTVPVVHIVSGSNSGTSDAFTDSIRTDQLTLFGTSGFLGAGSFAHIYGDLDGIHMKTQTQKQKAADTVTRYLRHLWGGGSQSRAPRYSSAVKSTNTCTITFTGGTSPLTHSGGNSEVYGWVATDGSGTLTVTSVTVSLLTATLTFNRNVSGTLTVKWCSGSVPFASAATETTLLDSDLTTPLPPEPFTATV